MIYYKKGTGSYVITEPRPWSRENQHLFENFNFQKSPPTTNEVETLLVNNYNFNLFHYADEDIIVLQNLDPNLNL